MPHRVWTFELEDGVHTVELYHGFWSGRRTIILDGTLVHESRKLFDNGSVHPFSIGPHECVVKISGDMSYHVTVDGAPVWMPAQPLVLETVRAAGTIARDQIMRRRKSDDDPALRILGDRRNHDVYEAVDRLSARSVVRAMIEKFRAWGNLPVEEYPSLLAWAVRQSHLNWREPVAAMWLIRLLEIPAKYRVATYWALVQRLEEQRITGGDLAYTRGAGVYWYACKQAVKVSFPLAALWCGYVGILQDASRPRCHGLLFPFSSALARL